MSYRSTPSQTCKNVNGVPSSINYDLTTTLTAEQNRGKTVQLEKAEVNVQAVCPAGAATYSQTYRSYVSPYPVVETSGNWKYLKLDPTTRKAECELRILRREISIRQ